MDPNAENRRCTHRDRQSAGNSFFGSAAPVLLHGLGTEELNGKSCEVVGVDLRSDRVKVRTPDSPVLRGCAGRTVLWSGFWGARGLRTEGGTEALLALLVLGARAPLLLTLLVVREQTAVLLGRDGVAMRLAIPVR